MSELMQFKLPDVGEGLTEADIVKWHVQAGDKVTVNQIIVEIETAKAVVELPCPFDGVVADLLAAEGSTVDVGVPIISVRVGEDAGSPDAGPPGAEAGAGADTPAVRPAALASAPGADAGAPAGSLDAAAAAAGPGSSAADLVPPPPAEGAVEPGLHGSPAPKEERQAVLVGYGVKLGPTTRRARKPAAAGGSQPAAPPASPLAAPANGSAAVPPGLTPPPPTVLVPPAALAPPPARIPAVAKPPVRKLARDLGVDLAGLAGSGPTGSITREDVQAAAAPPGAPAQPAAAPSGDTAAAAREERIPIRGVRKHTAAAMAASAFTAPHVTEFLQIDTTETMSATARLREMPEFEGTRVSPLLLVAKAVLVTAMRHPLINSRWDEAAQEIVIRNYVNLGIAAATDRGLVVPNIRDAQGLSLPALARALADLAQTARAGKATLADLQGGTITITNVGVFGIDTGTPILTPGETAILAFGRVKEAPWVHEGQLAVRQVTTLALSFDHRIVDGDLGSAALRDIGAMLEDPLRLLALS
jgi:2-oxoisovalerate dehydrogenase E2 component (dihydrolipoyl transacylase)